MRSIDFKKNRSYNTHIAKINPFRYRGYYFDTETGLYYLNSRYYDPATRRFINADDPSIPVLEQATDIGGLNLYSYCLNNPVNMADPNGNMPDWLKWVIGGVIIIGLTIATIATGGVAGGAAGFILAGALKGAIIGAVSSALVSGTIGGVFALAAGDNFWNGFVSGAADGFMFGAIIGGISGAISSSLQIVGATKLWANTGKKSSFRQMVEHYEHHVIEEGQKSVAKNIVNYTKQARSFFEENREVGRLLREGVIKVAGAPGGIFNTDGLIRSFWYIAR